MIVALAGGVGGAKLAHGLSMCLPPEELAVVVNTADDFDIYGLRVCPDLDTVTYTLAGVANPRTGWGVEGDTFAALEMLRRYGQDTWFLIGDRDLATDVLRTHLLREGRSLSDVVDAMSRSLGVRPAVVPMSDEPVATVIETPGGELDFQEYFVRRHHEPVVTGVRYEGVERATQAPAFLSALEAAEAVVICPSNPLVSVGPILAVPGVAEALERSPAPKVAVSPIVAGQALRGPADRMLESLGHEVSALGVARIYRGVVQGMVIDSADTPLQEDIRELGMEVLVTNTVMRDDSDRRALAEATLRFARTLGTGDER
jgi:LPPG:FO 2-phospho-L-lactate transferase